MADSHGVCVCTSFFGMEGAKLIAGSPKPVAGQGSTGPGPF